MQCTLDDWDTRHQHRDVADVNVHQPQCNMTCVLLGFSRSSSVWIYSDRSANGPNTTDSCNHCGRAFSAATLFIMTNALSMIYEAAVLQINSKLTVGQILGSKIKQLITVQKINAVKKFNARKHYANQRRQQ